METTHKALILMPRHAENDIPLLGFGGACVGYCYLEVVGISDKPSSLARGITGLRTLKFTSWVVPDLLKEGDSWHRELVRNRKEVKHPFEVCESCFINYLLKLIDLE